MAEKNSQRAQAVSFCGTDITRIEHFDHAGTDVPQNGSNRSATNTLTGSAMCHSRSFQSVNKVPEALKDDIPPVGNTPVCKASMSANKASKRSCIPRSADVPPEYKRSIHPTRRHAANTPRGTAISQEIRSDGTVSSRVFLARGSSRAEAGMLYENE